MPGSSSGRGPAPPGGVPGTPARASLLPRPSEAELDAHRPAVVAELDERGPPVVLDLERSVAALDRDPVEQVDLDGRLELDAVPFLADRETREAPGEADVAADVPPPGEPDHGAPHLDALDLAAGLDRGHHENVQVQQTRPGQAAEEAPLPLREVVLVLRAPVAALEGAHEAGPREEGLAPIPHGGVLGDVAAVVELCVGPEELV